MLSVLPDAIVTTLGTSVTIHVLANDSGGDLTVTSFSNPAHGNVIFNSDQSFTYTPTAGFVGTDSFAYTVRDAQGTPSGAEVTITVAPNDGATRATDDYIEMIAGGNAIIPVLSNDLTATGSLRLIAISVPGHGAANVLASQSIRYVPQSGFVGIDSFTYTVIDQAGTTT
ncbi:MAG: Ig-like domain-containing protein, partial [Geminicoccaceae bacterium]